MKVNWGRLKCKLFGHGWEDPVVGGFGVTEECRRCKTTRFTMTVG